MIIVFFRDQNFMTFCPLFMTLFRGHLSHPKGRKPSEKTSEVIFFGWLQLGSVPGQVALQSAKVRTIDVVLKVAIYTRCCTWQVSESKAIREVPNDAIYTHDCTLVCLASSIKIANRQIRWTASRRVWPCQRAEYVEHLQAIMSVCLQKRTRGEGKNMAIRKVGSRVKTHPSMLMFCKQHLCKNMAIVPWWWNVTNQLVVEEAQPAHVLKWSRNVRENVWSETYPGTFSLNPPTSSAQIWAGCSFTLTKQRTIF